jgi:hypothetical protein
MRHARIIRIVAHISLTLIVLVLLPSSVRAQSGIAGLVSDNTGGVLPGVTVEASSPALIEKTRSVTTDSQGRYSVVDLRPGTYALTFSLPGFGTVVMDKIELPATFMATVNAELRVGSLEESVTVSGASPVVDVQSTQHTQVMSRDAVDALPTSRGVTAIAAVIPGVKMSASDVGGSQTMEQTYGTAFGATQNYNTYEVDGMKLNSLSGDGRRTSYFNNALFSEVSYEVSGHSAESSSGGVRVNMIPREGGNAFRGQLYAGGTKGSWQWDNVTDALRARGLQLANSVSHIHDVNISEGGPILRNRVWFWASGAFQSTVDRVANTLQRNGEQGEEDQYVNNATVRLTYQISPKNKLGGYVDRIWKFKGHEFGALTDPDTAAGRRDPLLYAMGQAKFTSTVSSRMMLDVGFATNILRYTVNYQPGIRQERGTAGWYAGARKVDRDLGTSWNAASPEVLRIPDRYMWSASASYVTGSHTFKTGVQSSWGTYREFYTANADLTQEYRNGVPDSVLVYNTPSDSKTAMNTDLGIYVQDSWRFRRLTLNPGLRVDWFRGSTEETDQAAGRFAPVRHFDARKDLPNWRTIEPRFGSTYDLFGDAKTAVKFSASKYVPGEATQFPKNYDPVYLASERRTWRDANADDIAQDSEIGPSQNANFGLRSTATPDPDLAREYSWEYSIALQRELRQGIGVTGAWYRRNIRNLATTDNRLRSLDDWTPVNVVSPLNGEIITAYNLNVARRGLVDLYDTSVSDPSRRRTDFTGFELSGQARLGNGVNLTAGWTAGRTINVTCDSTDDPNSFRFCDQSVLGMPYRHDFKVAGNYPLPYSFQVSAVLVSYAGNLLGTSPSTRTDAIGSSAPQITTSTNWVISPSTRDANGTLVIPGMTEPSLTIALESPADAFLARFTQLDFGLKRAFRFGSREIQADLNLFNALNGNAVLGQNTTFGPVLGRPSSIVQGRLLRLAVQAKF